MKPTGRRHEDLVLSPVLSRYHPGLTITHGEGSYLYTNEGVRLFDLTSGIATTVLGHAHPEVVKAASEQLGKLSHICTAVADNPATLAYARKLIGVTPTGLNSVFFANSGAEAVEGALKLASFTTKRPVYIAFEGAFHGRTYAAMSLTAAKPLYRKNYEPLRSAVYHTPFPASVADVPYALEALDKLTEHLVDPSQIAAILVEPVQGEGGYVPAPPRFLEGLRERASNWGALLIFDEVQTGFGRTGSLFACLRYGVTPDVLVLAKSIANGLPLSAIVATSERMALWEAGAHGSTFGGNPVSCAAASATLDVILRDDLAKRAELLGETMEAALKSSGATKLFKTRRIGSMLALDLANEELAARVIERARTELHILLLTCGGHSDAIRFMPALNTDVQSLHDALLRLGQLVVTTHYA